MKIPTQQRQPGRLKVLEPRSTSRSVLLAGLCLGLALPLAASAQAAKLATGNATASSGAPPTALSVGEKIFNDPSLSSSGRLSCASCHDPAHGHASPFDTPIAMGGLGLDRPGTRLSPTLRYLRFNSAFHFDDEGKPVGGFNWDGSSQTFAEQARRPLLADNEMNNADEVDVAAKLARAPYAKEFEAVFGADSFASPQTTFERIGLALEIFQRTSEKLAPFSSKFDAVGAAKATFTPAEARGLKLFNREDKGNCAACHPSTKPDNAPAALFTDFSYDNLGVPRNGGVEANRDRAYFDLGLCGPARTHLKDRKDLCGQFKVPSLRNVALRKHFFHNGAFDSLEEVVRFYVQRDTHPERWYPANAAGKPQKFDDLPRSLHGNVNTDEAPYDRKPGQAPRLSEAEVKDVVAFLRTLSDGWKPAPNPRPHASTK